VTETLVIDASIAVKWVVEEEGTPFALMLRRNHRFVAPDLLVPECANILWKKTHRGELTSAEASLAAGLLERSDIELLPMRALFGKATELAVALDHPAHDCIYLSLAATRKLRFVTADKRLLRLIHQHKTSSGLEEICVSMQQVLDGHSERPPAGS
jgi:predicted nucleic acid-binding protein